MTGDQIFHLLEYSLAIGFAVFLFWMLLRD